MSLTSVDMMTYFYKVECSHIEKPKIGACDTVYSYSRLDLSSKYLTIQN